MKRRLALSGARAGRPARWSTRWIGACGGALALAVVVACGGDLATHRADGMDQSALPDGIRADYQVFADRCSKCHSLSRPLNSGIDSDAYWAQYVERMRRQPASGITREDVPVILRFLHYYTLQQQALKAAKNKADEQPATIVEVQPGATVNVQPGTTVNVAPGAAANVPAGTVVAVPVTVSADGGL